MTPWNQTSIFILLCVFLIGKTKKVIRWKIMYFSTMYVLKKISHFANISLLWAWSSREIQQWFSIWNPCQPSSRCLMKFPAWLPLRSVSLKGHRKVAVEINSRTPGQMTSRSALQKLKPIQSFLASYKISSCPVWAWQISAEGKSCSAS